jgi:MFS family permease
MLRDLRTLPRAVWLVGAISFLNDGASDLVYPLIPLYLSSVLMAGPRALGLIEGVAEATSSLLRLVSGVLRDRSGRTKPWIVAGYGMAGLGRPLIGLAGSWPWLLLIRFTDRVGKGLRSAPRDALLASSVPASRRGLAFGVHRALDNAGAVAGPLAAAGLLTAGVPLRQIFWWSAVPALACLALSLTLREPTQEAPRPQALPRDWTLARLPLPLRRYLVVLALFTLGNSSNLFLLLRARELGVPATQLPLLWAAVSAVAMLFSAPLSAWSDRVGRMGLLIGGYAAYALFYLAMACLNSTGLPLLLLFAGYGVFMAATEGVEKALIADLAPAAREGTAFGWFHLTTGCMLLPASLVFGQIYQSVSPAAAFGFSAGCAGLAALGLATWVRRGARAFGAPPTCV